MARNKLRRQNGIIAGVCGGLGEFFGLSPWIFRIIFLLLIPLPPAALLPYIILWLIIPRKRY
ncbi:MAG: PspC domain-containing protein [Chloroflexota bacterium]|nr:PspC domain-containing protein [Chloroflexota bacterium]